jgi:hypothetical protein
VTVDNGDRVLFSNAAINNVYTYDKATGTYIEDSNLESAGDLVYVIEGTSAGRTYRFNKLGQWVLENQSSLTEEGFIRDFVGKTAAGSEYPQYNSNHYIADNDSLKTATEKLDAGLDRARHEFSASAITAATVIDSVLVDEVRNAMWEVVVSKVDETAFRKVFIDAVHNGKTSADATITEFDTSDLKKIGTITGLAFNIVLAGSDVSQTMGLTVTATQSVNVKGIRRIIAV